LDRSAKISVTAGDVDFELDGSPTEIEERLSHLRQDDSWSIMIERLKKAREEAMDTAVDAAKKSGLPSRGADFKKLIDTYSLKRKPDQVLGAIHYLRDVEKVMDSPPRVINQLFDDAGIDSPGNLSLYLNRLREREFLIIPNGSEDKNRYAVLSPEGQEHLNKRSTK
jgi:hypothetical protein